MVITHDQNEVIFSGLLRWYDLFIGEDCVYPEGERQQTPEKGAGTMKNAWVMMTVKMMMCRCLCLEWKIHMY